MRVTIKPSALRELRGLPEDVVAAFDSALFVLKASRNPLRPSEWLDIKQLRRAKNHYRLRIGVYRGIFRWDGHSVDFVMFDHRRRVYDRLGELGV